MPIALTVEAAPFDLRIIVGAKIAQMLANAKSVIIGGGIKEVVKLFIAMITRCGAQLQKRAQHNQRDPFPHRRSHHNYSDLFQSRICGPVNKYCRGDTAVRVCIRRCAISERMTTKEKI